VLFAHLVGDAFGPICKRAPQTARAPAAKTRKRRDEAGERGPGVAIKGSDGTRYALVELEGRWETVNEDRVPLTGESFKEVVAGSGFEPLTSRL